MNVIIFDLDRTTGQDLLLFLYGDNTYAYVIQVSLSHLNNIIFILRLMK